MTPTITVDIGTTSIKLCLFDAEGGLQAADRCVTPTRRDAWGEVYDTAAVMDAVRGFVDALTPDARRGVQCISIAGVGESGGLVDPDLSLVSPMILWHDHRGADLLAGLSDADRARIYAVTGLPVNANYALSKVAWALANAERPTATAQWLNVSEYLAALLTGRRWAEPSLASRTMALDLVGRRWSREVCGLFGVDPSVFPPLRTAADGVAMDPATARAWGLDEVTVHVAGHDHMVGGAGADLRPGEMLDSTGTTEGVLALLRTPRLDAGTAATKVAGGLACDGEGFTLFASIPTGGSAFATLRTLLDRDSEELAALVARAHRDWITGAVDLDRLPLGMVRQFAEVWELFDLDLERVKVIGPASANPLWLQLKADYLGVPLSVAGFPEVVSRGAQALAHGIRLPWSASEPRDVPPDAGRAAALVSWRARTAARWAHLSEMPA